MVGFYQDNDFVVFYQDNDIMIGFYDNGVMAKIYVCTDLGTAVISLYSFQILSTFKLCIVK